MAQRSDEKTPTTRTVLNITELHELIMLQLPARAFIGIASRTSREWKILIDTSPKIQRMLMFRSASPEPARPYAYSQKCESIPLYSEAFEMNPALEPVPDLFTPPTVTLWGRSRDNAPRHFFETAGKQLVRIRRQEASEPSRWRADGSWRKMFLTDPPCSVARVRIQRTLLGPKCLIQLDTEAEFSIYEKGGIKLGLLEDIVQAALESARKHGRKMPSGSKVEREAYVDFFCAKPQSKL